MEQGIKEMVRRTIPYWIALQKRYILILPNSARSVVAKTDAVPIVAGMLQASTLLCPESEDAKIVRLQQLTPHVGRPSSHWSLHQ